ncbi:MAG: SDR family oxidoreductase [Ignavibacteria bacterium]
MKILVVGGTGTVGGEVVKLLLNRNADLRVLTSSKEKVDKLPKGAEGALGNLKVKDSLKNAFNGVDRVFLMTPLSETETEEGINGVEAASEAGVERIIYMSVHQLEEFKDSPHFSGKIPIENRIKSSGMDYTLIRPNNFFQNDYWFKIGLLEHSIYGQPIGNKGVSRVDVRDIAEAAVNSLLKDDFIGKTYNLVGSEILTGDETANIYSRYLDKGIKYAGDNLEAWANRSRPYMPEWLIQDFWRMYKQFQEKGFIATDEELEQTRRILGKDPRRYENFIKEVSGQWIKTSAKEEVNK